MIKCAMKLGKWLINEDSWQNDYNLINKIEGMPKHKKKTLKIVGD